MSPVYSESYVDAAYRAVGLEQNGARVEDESLLTDEDFLPGEDHGMGNFVLLAMGVLTGAAALAWIAKRWYN